MPFPSALPALASAYRTDRRFRVRGRRVPVRIRQKNSPPSGELPSHIADFQHVTPLGFKPKTFRTGI